MRNILPINNFEMINKEYFIIYIKNKRIALNSKPGRFFELLPKGDFKGLLRKPISIYSVVDDKVGFMIKNVGYGTNYLSQLKNGDFVDFLGPLGNTFGVVKNKRILLISGGIGFAPLYYLNQELKKNNNSVVWIHGGRSYNDIFDKTLVNYTNDGSYGIKGFVTSDLEKILKEKKIQKVYTCGPKIMMKKVAKITDKLGVETEVSLESYMACGIGVCKGCSVLINENNSQVYKTVCKDGPIFNSKEVVWNE